MAPPEDNVLGEFRLIVKEPTQVGAQRSRRSYSVRIYLIGVKARFWRVRSEEGDLVV